MTSLSDDAVRSIREMYATGHTYAEIAETYGIDKQRVSDFVLGRRRRSAGGPIANRPPNPAAQRLKPAQIERIKRLRLRGLSQLDTAKLVGCSPFTVSRYAPGYVGKVSNDALRDAFLQSGLDAKEVARRLGWTRWDGHYDGYRVLLFLGLRATVRSMIDVEVAEQLAEVLGIEADFLERDAA